ncbi:MAG: sigma factor-like helix-turn-helix DNA-binding protein [Patescibacteria group bacterium]|jgi:hypothetical protein|nr:sigma factor-like helix-turn-helix DNA-binding protein [Patescibacteria group bacterium]
MENKSILDQILLNQKVEEVAKLNAVEIINNLFSELNERESDIIVRRFGLHGEKKETLENIGNVHNLTRERIRQIETYSIKKLQQLDVLEKHLQSLKKIIVALIEEHGGLMEKEYLLDVLVKFSLNSGSEIKNENVHKKYLNFLITKLLHTEFEELNSSMHLLPSYKLKHQTINHFEEIIDELTKKVKEEADVKRTEEVLSKIKEELDSYKTHQEKVDIEDTIDISSALNNELFEENYDLINKNKVLYSALKAAKRINQNKFGHWGLHDSKEIKPKTVNDKIYLILKYKSKPMHFVEIADEINFIAFDKKKANPATVHNELILDDKFILIGRGLYGLNEWGYKRGTVADVIEEILKEKDSGLTRDEIIDEVLKRRVVKKTTIILALMNKDKFSRDNGAYILK